MVPRVNFMFPADLRSMFEYKFAFNDTNLHAPPMQQGYALMIEEGPDNTMTAYKRICTGTGFGVALVRVLLTRHQEIDQLLLLLRCLDCILLFWALYYRGPLKNAFQFALPTALVKFLLTLYWVDGEGMKIKLMGSVSAFTIPVVSILLPLSIWLVEKYSLAIDWKDIRGLFRPPQKSKAS